MNTGLDARDFERGVSEWRRPSGGYSRKTIDIKQIEATEHFDGAFRTDVNAVIGHLSRGYEAVNAIGLHRSSEKPPYVQQAFFLFHEALNLTFVALRTDSRRLNSRKRRRPPSGSRACMRCVPHHVRQFWRDAKEVSSGRTTRSKVDLRDEENLPTDRTVIWHSLELSGPRVAGARSAQHIKGRAER